MNDTDFWPGFWLGVLTVLITIPLGLLIWRSTREFKDTPTRVDNCIVQVYQPEPTYRLECK